MSASLISSTPGEAVCAALYAGPARIEMAMFPRPQIGPDEGLLFVEANGICGTDVHYFYANRPPMILGHEVVGEIAEIGDEAAKRWNVSPGDRVAVEASISCGVCEQCLDGFFQSCQTSLGYGTRVPVQREPSLWGGLAQLMYLAPGSVVTKVPPGISAGVAAGWLSPLANGIEWSGPGAGEVQVGDSVVVLGPGPQGLACCIAARERGAGNVIVAGLARDRARLTAATQLGADRVVMVDNESLADVVHASTDGRMADVVIDVSGSTQAARSAVEVVRRRGTIVAASPVNGPIEVTLPLAEMVIKQVRWQGVLANRAPASRAAAELLASSSYDFLSLVTHRFELPETERAIRLVAGEIENETPVKVIVCPNGVARST